MKNSYPFESYITSVVRPLTQTTRDERLKIIKEAKYNIFNIHSCDVMVDLPPHPECPVRKHGDEWDK